MNHAAKYLEPYALQHGLEIHPYGYLHVKDTDDCQVMIAHMGFNWRVLEVLYGGAGMLGPARGWCYRAPLETVIEAARRWDGAPDSEPSGWIKAVGTERRHGEPAEGVRQL